MENPNYLAFLNKTVIKKEENENIYFNSNRIRLDDLNFTQRAQYLFKHTLHICYVDELVKYSCKDLMQQRNIGKITLYGIKETIKELGLYLKDDFIDENEKLSRLDKIKHSRKCIEEYIAGITRNLLFIEEILKEFNEEILKISNNEKSP